jgi:hypothetical protein
MIWLAIVFAIAVFGLALFSPKLSRKVERKTTRETTTLKRRSNSLWAPLTFMARGGLDLFKRMTKLSASGGRKVRKKAKNDD